MHTGLARAVLLLSMSLAVPYVNASAQKKAQAKAVSDGTPLEVLIAEVLASGSEEIYSEGISGLLGVPPGTKAKRTAITRKETNDGLLRAFDILVDPSTTSMRTLCLVSRSIWKDVARSEGGTLLLRLSPQGVLERALETRSKYDTQGRQIQGWGVGKTVNLDINLPATKLLLQRELDFWLKGIGRKPNVPAAENMASEIPSEGSRPVLDPAKKR